MLSVRFRFEGRCAVHARYNPAKDGRPQHSHCAGCDSLWVIYLYSTIARKKAESGDGIVVHGGNSRVLSKPHDRPPAIAVQNKPEEDEI